MVAMLEVDNVQVKIGEKILLDNLSLTVDKGSVIALVGHNGAGKSTFIRTVMGMMDMSQGSIRVNTYDREMAFLDYKRNIAYLPEEPMLLSELTVLQHFQLYGLTYEIGEETLHKRIQTYVKGFELEEQLDKFPEELSKGMRQKVQTICAFLPDVPLILIDEPFMGLDIYAIDYIEQCMKQKIADGVSMVISSHQLERVRDLADQYVLLQQGEVVHKGPIDEFETIKRSTDV